LSLSPRADCGNCAALCCVAPGFAASADFAIGKGPGQPCPHLRGADLARGPVPLMAPTDVPITMSGRTPALASAQSMPTSWAPRTPPPPSTNAVVTRQPPRVRRYRGAGSSPAGEPPAAGEAPAAGNGLTPASALSAMWPSCRAASWHT
jgi:hypothetical protein